MVIDGELSFLADEKDALRPPFRIESLGLWKIRMFPTVVPGQLDWGEIFARAVLIPGDHPIRWRLGVHGRTFGLDVQRVAEFQRPEGEILQVRAHVADGSLAEVRIIMP